MKIIDRYIAIAVIGGTVLVAFFLLALSGFISFVGQLDDIGKGTYSLGDVVTFVLFSMPEQVYQLFPMSVLLGSLLGLGMLANNNELMVMRTAGLSIFRLGRSALLGGVTLALFCFLLGDYLVPPAESFAKSLKTSAVYQRVSLFGRRGIWARDGDLFVNVRQMTETGKLEGIYFFELDKEGRLVRTANAAQAVLEEDGWRLLGLEQTNLQERSTATVVEDNARWQTMLNPQLLQLFVVEPETLSTGGLLDYIDYLERNELNSEQYEMAFWIKVVTPFSVLVMVILALPFVFGPLRSVGTGQRIMVGILIGVVFYLVNRTLIHSGMVFGLNSMIVAWLPTTVLAALSFLGIRRIN
ncbi:MAG: LPS export ABC transporter permease LptG [Gammaproteobacteria bacterium]|nr:LPS export ABC transporter permease LptG [Gammaproteobacteria bacterium]